MAAFQPPPKSGFIESLRNIIAGRVLLGELFAGAQPRQVGRAACCAGRTTDLEGFASDCLAGGDQMLGMAPRGDAAAGDGRGAGNHRGRLLQRRADGTGGGVRGVVHGPAVNAASLVLLQARLPLLTGRRRGFAVDRAVGQAIRDHANRCRQSTSRS